MRGWDERMHACMRGRGCPGAIGLCVEHMHWRSTCACMHGGSTARHHPHEGSSPYARMRVCFGCTCVDAAATRSIVLWFGVLLHGSLLPMAARVVVMQPYDVGTVAACVAACEATLLRCVDGAAHSLFCSALAQCSGGGSGLHGTGWMPSRHCQSAWRWLGALAVVPVVWSCAPG